MDSGPRIHAQQICRLAAAAGQWDIFLRAHLNIMNDKFERNSDGPYARARRQTYLPELEALDINTVDLLIGSCLGASDMNEKHYEGSVLRVARALIDSKERNTISKRLLNMVSDTKLDLNNRMIMCWLLYNFYNHLLDRELLPKVKVDLLNAINHLPKDLRVKLKSMLIA